MGQGMARDGFGNSHSYSESKPKAGGNPPHVDPLTEHQLVQFGALMAWANQVHGVPLVLSESTTEPGCRMTTDAWGPGDGLPVRCAGQHAQ